MGKCKKRTLYKNNSSFFMTREEAISNILEELNENDFVVSTDHAVFFENRRIYSLPENAAVN